MKSTVVLCGVLAFSHEAFEHSTFHLGETYLTSQMEEVPIVACKDPSHF